MKFSWLLLVLLVWPWVACNYSPAGQPAITPALEGTPNSGVNLTGPQLKYLLIDEFGIFFCDPDYYPIGRPGQEEERAIEVFPGILEDRDLFDAIASRLGVAPGATFTDGQKLDFYRQNKKLNAVQLKPQGGGFTFDIRAGDEAEGFEISGTISPQGRIEVQRKEAALLTCPICLLPDTLIDTPLGPIPVHELKVGMPVWTSSVSGDRVAAPVVRVGSVPVPPGHQLVGMVLGDGRRLDASPGHPLADGRNLGGVVVGDRVDGSSVITLERRPYRGNTFDLLPDGETGQYWANGILVASSLAAAKAR